MPPTMYDSLERCLWQTLSCAFTGVEVVRGCGSESDATIAGPRQGQARRCRGAAHRPLRSTSPGGGPVHNPEAHAPRTRSTTRRISARTRACRWSAATEPTARARGRTTPRARPTPHVLFSSVSQSGPAECLKVFSRGFQSVLGFFQEGFRIHVTFIFSHQN